jgi:hypothetical protein
MNEDLEKQIIADLEKSGFSSELRAIRAFITAGWGCTGFANYFDKDLELITSVDLRAWRELEDKTDKLITEADFYIEGEVKKSERPWIVFKEKSTRVIDDHFNNLTYVYGFAPFRLSAGLTQNSIYSHLGWRGYGIHESFKKPDSPSRAYSALVKASKAAEATLVATSAFYEEMKESEKGLENLPKHHACVFVKPVVILDGILISAELSTEGSIVLEEINYAPVELRYRSKHCQKGVYLIDIVTLDNLAEYIKLSESRHQSIFDYVELLG